jgi:hypothetical protein
MKANVKAMKSRKSRANNRKVETSSSNVFADLGFKDAERRLMKAKLATKIAQLIEISSFNMWMDQVDQVRAIIEATGAVKDAPVIRELLDEALGARRRKAAGIYDSEEPPGQGTAETLHTLQTLLLKLIRHEDLLLRNQRVASMICADGRQGVPSFVRKSPCSR